MPKHHKKSAGGKKKLEWYFPSTGHGENAGFADPLLEYFEGNHEKFIARETIQNAVDARESYEIPVSVTFERMTVPVSELPQNSELTDRLRRCVAFEKGRKKSEAFFTAAIDLLKSDELAVLKISDFNTKGLSGSDDDVSGNWYRLVRTIGTSDAKGAGGGSFGIGKGAPFAASALRTVFYSSVDRDGHAVFQGKARLVSHHDKTKDVRQGVGFYGISGYQAIRETGMIPDFFKRTETGTDIFIMGYTGEQEWETKLIESVLRNFWLAIHRGDLEVTIKNEATEKIITAETLPQYLDDYEAENAKFYFDAVTSPSQEFRQELKHLGTVDLYVKKGEGFPKKVMMARKPKMVVQEKEYRVLREPFAAVFLCENDRGNTLLRDMEPPAHDDWNKDRVEKNGWAALQELEGFIKESLKGMNEAITSAPEDIPGLDRYLPESEERESLGKTDALPRDKTEKTGTEESGREVGSVQEPAPVTIDTVVRKGVVTSRQMGSVKPGTSEGSGGSSRKGVPTGGAPGDKKGVRIKTSNISFRSFVQKEKTGFVYHFILTGRESCEGAIKIVAVGDDSNYTVQLHEATDAQTGKQYKIEESLITGLSIESGKSLRLAVTIPSKKKYALGIENYEG